MLDAYRYKDLQHIYQFLRQIDADGISIVDALEMLQKRLAYNQTNTAGPARKYTCPDCGSSMSPVVNSDGLRIMGCKKCRYSEIRNGV